MLTWEQWKNRYADKIQHIAGFEERFVDTVLAKIPLIKPENVTPQYHFVDHKNGNRYIDFMITIGDNPAKTLLPIELDGKTKFETYQSFNDTLERQNDLIKQFGVLLRYSNKKMIENPDEIIGEITLFIENTLQHKDNERLKQKNLEQYQENIQQQLKLLSQKVDNLNEQKIAQMIENKIKLQKSEALPTTISHKSKLASQVEIKTLTIIAAILLFVFLGYHFFIKSKDTSGEAEVIQKTPETLPINHSEANHLLATQINAQQIGKEIKVCGLLSEIRPFKKGIYLNFDKPYPEQSLSAVIWDSELSKFDTHHLKSLELKSICITGRLEQYQNKMQITLENPTQLTE